MPFGDRTGPAGQGPRTGRGAGFCGRFGVPGSMNRGAGQGLFGGGRGGAGRGWRHCFNATGLTGWQRAFGWRRGRTGASVPTSTTSAVTGCEEELAQFKDQAGSSRARLKTSASASKCWKPRRSRSRETRG